MQRLSQQTRSLVSRFRQAGVVRRAATYSRSFASSTASGDQARLKDLEAEFKELVSAHLPADGKGVAFATAWLHTDNVIVDLFKKHAPKVFDGMAWVAVDTLHLFPETHELMARMQQRYEREATVYKPIGLETMEDFERVHGHREAISHADFDQHSKVEPFNRVLSDVGKEILITGRRRDQGNARVELDAWEADRKIFNPMASWSLEDVLAYVDEHDVPVNKAHNYVWRHDEWLCPRTRHEPEALPWKKFDLGKPYWRASRKELRGSPPSEHVFVYKSFGDIHTTVPVYPHESERAGRFVRYENTECGIHTRAAIPGEPHGGKLVDLMVGGSEAASPDATPEQRAVAAKAKQDLLADVAARTEDGDLSGVTWELSERQATSVAQLLSGGFSPLTGFMNQEEYTSVLEHMRLPEQQLWPMPMNLDLPDAAAKRVKDGDRIVLAYKGKHVAVLDVADVWKPDKVKEAHHLFGTTRMDHPGVFDLFEGTGPVYVGGKLHGLEMPDLVPSLPDGLAKAAGFGESAEAAEEFRSAAASRFYTPKEVRAMHGMTPSGPSDTPIVYFQARNPLHQAHYQLVLRALEKQGEDARMMVHLTTGPTQPGDIDPALRIATYEALQRERPHERITWGYLPYSMRMAGPREALQHLLIRKNFGATHFVVGRDMAGTKSTVTGEDFHGPYDAQVMAEQFASELGVTVETFENVVYTEEKGFVPESEAKAEGLEVQKLSGTEFRRRMRAGEAIPEWFAFPSVVGVLREAMAAPAPAGEGSAAAGSAGAGQQAASANGADSESEEEGAREGARA